MDVAVLGATERGQRIASRCVPADHSVLLYDGDSNAVMDSIDAIEHRHGDGENVAIDGTTGLEAAVTDADVVVDATDGTEAARRDLVADVEERVSSDALFAISGVTVSVTAIAAGLRRPGRTVGLHTVEADGLSVVEIAVADQTTESARERAAAFVTGLDATPLSVRDCPGFASTRLDMAQIVEATRMVEDGVASVADVDRAVERGRDSSTGPLARADEIGLGSVLQTLEALAERYGDRFDPPDLLCAKVNDGARGVTTGNGFYVWEGGERIEPAEPDPTVQGRQDAEMDTGGREPSF